MKSLKFGRVIRFRVEDELGAAIEAAALAEKTSASEYMRRGLRRLVLPSSPFDSGTSPAAPSMRAAA